MSALTPADVDAVCDLVHDLCGLCWDESKAYLLAVPCLTLRENTERHITIDQGTNTLVGRDRDAILQAVDTVLANGGKRGRVPELWDGRASERIAADIEDHAVIRCARDRQRLGIGHRFELFGDDAVARQNDGAVA